MSKEIYFGLPSPICPFQLLKEAIDFCGNIKGNNVADHLMDRITWQ
jgi:hypothetical protein